MFAGLSSILLITSAAAQSCPANQVASDAQIVLNAEAVVPASVFARLTPTDVNLTYFTEVLRYSDEEIEQEVQTVLQFFSERFGLDFSPSQPNELGQRFFQNATLQPGRLQIDNLICATLNRWFLTGNTRSKCFPVSVGGFRVLFSGDQILKGTYGGAEGIDVPNDRVLEYEYVSISVPPPCEPVVILRRSLMPLRNRRTSDDQLFVIFYELSHRTLGRGAEHGVIQFQVVANGTSRNFLFSGITVQTFPPNVLTFN